MERVFKVIKVDDERIYGAYETLSKKTLLEDYKVSIITKEQIENIIYEIED